MGKELIIPVRSLQEMQYAIARVTQAIGKGLERAPVEVALRHQEDVRTLSQNRKLWPMLSDVATQVQLVVDGELLWATPEDWKDVFTSALRKHQRVARGIDGGVVMLGVRTSKMRKKEFSDLIEIMYAYGSENGVQWSEKALAVYEQYREAAA